MMAGRSGAPAATNMRQLRYTMTMVNLVGNENIINLSAFLQKTWDEAHTYCVCTKDAELVDIKSKAEDGFIQALTGGTEAIWTGKCRSSPASSSD